MSDFLNAAQEILDEYGEPVSIINRSGTVTATAVKAYADPVSGFEDFYPEGGDNTNDPGLCSIYMLGTVTLQNGYSIVRSAGTYEVLSVQAPQDGTAVVLRIAKCRRI